jgi:hypothetical protein
MEHSNPDLILSDGREVTIDLNKISVKEFRASLEKDQTFEDEYKTIEKVTGLQNVGEMGYEDYRRLIQAYIDKARAPIVNPT